MIALLTTARLRVDLPEFRKPRPPPAFPELIWKLHEIIANSASCTEEVKIAKHALLDAIGGVETIPDWAARHPSLETTTSRAVHSQTGGSDFSGKQTTTN